MPEEERVAYTTVQTLVYRLEEKGALRKAKKIGNAQLFEPAIDQSEYRSELVRDLLDLFGGSPRLLVSNLLETGTITLRDLKSFKTQHQTARTAAAVEGKAMHELVTRALYYFEVHLLFASIVWCAAWVLTLIGRGSATTMYWIWVATLLNFILPVGAMFDKLLAAHLSWAKPLGVIGDLADSISRHAPTATLLCAVWLLGATLMFTRLRLRIRADQRDAQVGAARRSAPDPRPWRRPCVRTGKARQPRTRVLVAGDSLFILEPTPCPAGCCSASTEGPRSEHCVGAGVHRCASFGFLEPYAYSLFFRR